MKRNLPKAATSTLSEIQDESASAVLAPVTVTGPQPAPGESGRSDEALRRAQASIIVGRYTTYSALGSCIPFAIFDALGVTVIIVNMVRALSQHYHVAFQEDRVRACIAALAAGIATPAAGSVATHLLGKLVPGGWLVGTAVSSVAAAGLTRYIGQAYVEHFEAGGDVFDLDIAVLRSRLRWS